MIIKGHITKKGLALQKTDPLKKLEKNNIGCTWSAYIHVFPKGEGKAKSAMIGYYDHVLIPAMRDLLYDGGISMTLKQTDELMLSCSPKMVIEEYVDNHGYVTKGHRNQYSATYDQLLAHIEHVKYIALEFFNTNIEAK